LIPRRLRLKDSEKIREIKTNGEAFSSRLLVLICAESPDQYSRVAVLASRSVGGAVQRNRCKRVLRVQAAKLISKMDKPVNLLLIAKKALLDADSSEIDQTVLALGTEAGLICRDDGCKSE